MNALTARDERETSVDQKADRMSYLVLSFGLLANVAYRSYANHESSWDLLGLVILAGAVGTVQRIRQRVTTRSWLLVAGITAGVALVLAMVIAFASRA